MLGANLFVPAAPEGVEPAAHLRSVLAQGCADAAETTERLHLEVDRHLRDEAATASLTLRELRTAIREAIEQELCDEELLVMLLAHLTRAMEQGEHVLMASDLRRAFEHDPSVWDEVSSRALVIGELAGTLFLGFVVNELGGDLERLAETERLADVPLMHALMRAISGGVQRATSAPLAARDLGFIFDELLHKVLTEHAERIDPADPMRHLRLAGSASTALWNLTRICRRDHMTSVESRRDVAARAKALAPLRAALCLQQRALGRLPDLEFAWDVGLAFGSVEPILLARAEGHRVQMQLRANPWGWYDLFRSLPTD